MTQNKEWIRLRRSLVQHVRLGHLGMSEFIVYVVLKLLADEETGEVTTSSRAVHAMLRPGRSLSVIGVSRAIHRLESKGYLSRDVSSRPEGYVIRINEAPGREQRAEETE